MRKWSRRLLAAGTAVALLGGVTWWGTALVEQRDRADAANPSGVNLARLTGVTARQWPPPPNPGVAERAIDGSTNGDFAANSVSHTGIADDPVMTPWWEVDLGAVYPLDRVVIFGRTDCCTDRLRDFSVLVSDQPIPSNVLQWNVGLNGVWHTNIRQQVDRSMTVAVPTTGRYLRIQQRRNVWLSLAEVQVFASTPAGQATPVDPQAPQREVTSNLVREPGVVVSQSSEWNAAVPTAARAVDGNTDGVFDRGSVSHTKTDEPGRAWWQADLGAVRRVERIDIWNRTDCCDFRLADAVVFTSETPFTSTDPTVTAAQPGVATFPLGPTLARYSIAIGRNARYVRVQSALEAQPLQIAEIEVTGFPFTNPATRVNLARSVGAAASQSSTLTNIANPVAAKAVDGNPNGRFDAGSVSHTDWSLSADWHWWQVDLGASQRLEFVRIHPRTDCCPDRVTSGYLLLAERPIVASDPAVAAREPGVTVLRTPDAFAPVFNLVVARNARYVRFVPRAVGVSVQLAEVEVHGTPANDPSLWTNMAREAGAVATQSSEWDGFAGSTAARAVDGNPDGRMTANSVAHTREGAPDAHWWQVALAGTRNVHRIRVFNRTDCCQFRLADAYVFVSDSPFSSVDPNVLAADPAVSTFRLTGEANEYSIDLNRTARYVRVQSPVAGRVLNIAEVMVMGSVVLPRHQPLPAEPLPAVYNNRAESLKFGVRGWVQAGQPFQTFLGGEFAEVWALKVIGDRVYVGGKFLEVVENATGRAIPQRFLAAFRVSDGERVAGFNPVLSGAVSDLQATPDGRLIVTGAFRTVNGQPAGGIAVLDPATGALSPGWRGSVNGGSATVMEADVQGDWIYAAGGFTSAVGGPAGTTVANLRNAVRFRLADGTPDTVWRPQVLGSSQGSLVTGLDASADGGRVYLAGFFGSIGGAPGTSNSAWVNTDNGAAVPGLAPHVPDFPGKEAQIWDVVEGPSGLVFEIGTQHVVQAVNKQTKAEGRLHSTLCQPNQNSCGGDFQAGTIIGDSLFATCHCLGSTLFYDITAKQLWANKPPNEADTFRQPAQGVARFNAATFEPDPDFAPEVWYDGGGPGVGQGGWAVAGDSSSCLWIGGGVEFVRERTGGKRVEQRGFTRFCPADATVPAAPRSLTAGWSATGRVQLSWPDARDDRPGRVFEVLRNGIVITTTDAPGFEDASGKVGDNYLVRTRDRRGNRSATTALVTVAPRPDPVVASIAAGSAWRWTTDLSVVDWHAVNLDDAAWRIGNAEFGWGDGDEVTTVDGKPTALRFRRAFQVDPRVRVTAATLSLKYDDGAVVFVNGTEVARFNLPADPLGPTTVATGFVSGASETRWTDVNVPPELLKPGANTVTVQLHQAQTVNDDATFDLTLTARGS